MCVMEEEPDSFQITNYNIQPFLAVTFENPSPGKLYNNETPFFALTYVFIKIEDYVMKAELIEAEASAVIPKGFQSGDVQPVPKGTWYQST